LPVDCAKELFKPSKDLASLLVRNEKKNLSFGFFVGDVISGVCEQAFNVKSGIMLIAF